MAEDAMSVRVDKWLWAARFFKTRRLASEAVKAGHIECDGGKMKASKLLKVGDVLRIRRGQEVYEVEVLALAEKRGSATVAQTLYREQEASIQARLHLQEQRRMRAASAPAPERKPDKKSRRHIIRFKQG